MVHGAEAQLGDGHEAVRGLGAQVGRDDRVGDDERADRGVGWKPPPMPAETTRSYGASEGEAAVSAVAAQAAAAAGPTPAATTSNTPGVAAGDRCSS